ncbi:tetratricopeptide repeat protein [Neptunomonas sp. XY-337]|uniref:tetratricopeptide repeat protein n=1 Tax=Neptunomonas sp. XY-337 TaxID=2561897 RepID=UPI0010A9F2BE|nr:tetratricopeptide repeat protein [Neptunomonas sp. XY-337]
MKTHNALVAKATALFQQGKSALAAAVCKKILQTHPENYQANIILGAITLHSAPEEAIPYLEQASSSATTPALKAQAMSNLSLAFGLLSRHEEALNAINQAVDCAPQHPLFLCNRANTLEQLRKWSLMEQDLQKALQIDPSLQDARLSLAVSLRHQTRWPEALAQLDQIDRNDWAVCAEKAIVLWLNGEPNAALKQAATLPLASLRSAADYAAEQGGTELAIALFTDYVAQCPSDTSSQFQLHALQGTAIEQPPADYIESVFDNCADKFESHLVNTLSYSAHQHVASLTAQFLSLPPVELLDLGCGTGLVGKELRKALPTCALAGVDLSANMLKLAEEQSIYNRLIQSDIDSLLNDTPPFSGITAADTVIYFGALEPLFAGVSRSLLAKGIFVFNTEKLSEGAADSWQLTPSGRYQHHKAYIKNLAAEHGMQLQFSEDRIIRHENDQAVVGTIFVLQKQ